MSVPLPPAPSPPCPNCGLPWLPDAPVCPNCGYVRPEIPSWPPTPGGQPGLAALPPSKLVTGSATGDIFLGLGISLASFLVGIGIVVMPVLYFVLRRSYPILARGLGFGWLAGMALLLGAFAICIVDLSQNFQNGG